AIALMLETVAKQPDEILKSEWVKSLSSRFGVEEESVLRQLRKAGASGPRPAPARAAAPPPVNDMPAIERGFLQLLLRDPALAATAHGLKPEDFSSPLSRKFFAALCGMPAESGAAAATRLAELFPGDAPLIMELAVSDPGGADDATQNAAGAIRRIKRSAMERYLKELKSSGQMTPEQLQEYSTLMSALKSSDKDL
ncbi:MAG TPA: hypothetical protein PKI19_06035, partial [Elusimicrobiales bacterium]|nr:hypothetical protein [Elusimicrobiales bacterium]